MSLKYGTPNLCAKSRITSLPKGSIGRHTRTPFTVFSGTMPVTKRGKVGRTYSWARVCVKEAGAREVKG